MCVCLCVCMQDSQVAEECVIEQKYHRNIMGPKGTNVQGITQEFNVGIKFPDRNNAPRQAVVENGSAEEEESDQGVVGLDPDPRNVIVITGRAENVAGAKQALLVSLHPLPLIP